MKKDINVKKDGNKPQRTYKLAAMVICLVFATSLFLLLFTFFINKKEESITCDEWLEMLCGQFGMEPDAGGGIADFEEDEYASGCFIALTAVRAIGDNKLQIYLETETVVDDACIELAIEYGLIKEKQLKSRFTRKECEQVLENLNSLYFGQFWRDDYSYVAYQEGVVELSEKDVIYGDADGMALAVADNGSIHEGSIIVLEQEQTGLKIAREVAAINADGTLSLKPAKLEEAVDTLIVSDITELTFGDIVNYYGLGEENNGATQLNFPYTNANVRKAAAFRFDTSSKGFKLSLSTKGQREDRHLEIQVTDNATGVSYTLPIQIEVEADSEYSAEINIDKIALGAQVNYSALENSFKYADAALDVHAIISGTVKAAEEKSIPLFKTPVPLGNGIVGVDVQINLVLSVEGGISFQAELPMQLAVNYEKGRGFRNTGHGISVENPMLEANCTAGAGLRIEPILVVLGFDVMDVEADIKAQAQAKVQTHSNGQICSDISLALPIVVLSVCGDEDADTIIGKLGVSAKWEVLSAGNAPFQKGLHYEALPGKTMQLVKKCTYGEEEKQKPAWAGDGWRWEKEEEDRKDTDEEEPVNTYYVRYGEVNFVNSPAFCFDYPDNWTITSEEVANENQSDKHHYIDEKVELTNERGVTITYMAFHGKIPNTGRILKRYQGIKVADTLFDSSCPGSVFDYSYLGNFAVAKIKHTGDLQMDTDADFRESDGAVFYAVLPEKRIEEYDGVFVSQGTNGLYCEFSFDYTMPYLFMAQAPEWEFTEEEEREVITILSSFRTGEEEPSGPSESGTLPTDGDRIVLTGTVGTYDYDGIITLQGQPDPNAPYYDESDLEYNRSMTFRVIVLDMPQTLSLQSGDYSGDYSSHEALMICINYADGMNQYEGQHITFSIDPANTWWPSDTSLPLGQPGTTDIHILD